MASAVATHVGRLRAYPIVAALLLALMLALATPVVRPTVSTARADVVGQVPGGEQVAEVALTAVRPSVAGADDVLRLTGVLTNVSDDDLVDPLPALRWSGDPLQSVDEVDLVAANPFFRYGRIDYRFAEGWQYVLAHEIKDQSFTFRKQADGTVRFRQSILMQTTEEMVRQRNAHNMARSRAALQGANRLRHDSLDWFSEHSATIVGDLRRAIGKTVAAHEDERRRRGKGVAWGDARDLLVGDDE